MTPVKFQHRCPVPINSTWIYSFSGRKVLGAGYFRPNWSKISLKKKKIGSLLSCLQINGCHSNSYSDRVPIRRDSYERFVIPTNDMEDSTKWNRAIWSHTEMFTALRSGTFANINMTNWNYGQYYHNIEFFHSDPIVNHGRVSLDIEIAQDSWKWLVVPLSITCHLHVLPPFFLVLFCINLHHGRLVWDSSDLLRLFAPDRNNTTDGSIHRNTLERCSSFHSQSIFSNIASSLRSKAIPIAHPTHNYYDNHCLQLWFTNHHSNHILPVQIRVLIDFLTLNTH